MMKSIALDRRASRHQETASRVIDGEAIVLRPMDNSILSLNRAGSRIWELLADSPTVGGIVETICEEFDVERERAAPDVVTFLTMLVEKGLATVTDEPTP